MARLSRVHRRRRAIAVLAGGVAGLVVVAIVVWSLFGARIMSQLNGPADYSGSGSGDVTVSIPTGSNGSDIARILADDDVVASAEAFYRLLAADSSISLSAGTYAMHGQMSAQAALDALQDPESRVEVRVTVPEGYMIGQVYARLAEATGLPVSDFEAAGADLAAFDLPPEAFDLEGWLFPATYTFTGDESAQQILLALVNRMHQALADHGVAEEDAQRVVVFASLVQREAGPVENFGRVARVFQNRLDIGMLLQSDATVAYGTGNTHVVTTTQAERGDTANIYNTYQHPGLPAGPIGAPGDDAITAVLSPDPGDWIYFVTVDLETGETVFSSTAEEHDAAVQRFREWYADHPEYHG